MVKSTLIGVGNHGQDISAIWWRVYGDTHWLIPYDDDTNLGCDPTPPRHGNIVIGVNDSTLRREIAGRFKQLRAIEPLVDPSVILGPRVNIGRGSVVAPGAILLRDVTLGDHVHVNYQASMTRCTVGNFTTIAPSATICGNVSIGDECVVGAGATICERSSLGYHVTIGAGAIVPPHSHIPDYVTVVGVWKG